MNREEQIFIQRIHHDELSDLLEMKARETQLNLLDGARLCLGDQPQHFRVLSRIQSFQCAQQSEAAAAGLGRHSYAPGLRPSSLSGLILCMLVGAIAGTARGELQVVPASEPTRIFAGAARSFPVVWQNTGDTTVTTEVRMRLLQASSATTTTLGEWTWKKLQILPGQTITERATLDFPEVKAETRFLVKWLEGTNRANLPPHEPRGSGRESAPSNPPASESRLTSAATIGNFGITEVLVYPTNLLAELKSLAGEDQPVGVFDPANTLKPMLKAAGVESEDLQDSGVADFRGKLALLGPFNSREQMPGDLGERIEKLARKGAGVVWLQPPPAPRAKLQPSFRTVPVGEGAVLVVQPSLVTNLADNPQAQLNLLHCCHLALKPEPPRLPNPNPQP